MTSTSGRTILRQKEYYLSVSQARPMLTTVVVRSGLASVTHYETRVKLPCFQCTQGAHQFPIFFFALPCSCTQQPVNFIYASSEDSTWTSLPGGPGPQHRLLFQLLQSWCASWCQFLALVYLLPESSQLWSIILLVGVGLGQVTPLPNELLGVIWHPVWPEVGLLIIINSKISIIRVNYSQR